MYVAESCFAVRCLCLALSRCEYTEALRAHCCSLCNKETRKKVTGWRVEFKERTGYDDRYYQDDGSHVLRDVDDLLAVLSSPAGEEYWS